MGDKIGQIIGVIVIAVLIGIVILVITHFLTDFDNWGNEALAPLLGQSSGYRMKSAVR